MIFKGYFCCYLIDGINTSQKSFMLPLFISTQRGTPHKKKLSPRTFTELDKTVFDNLPSKRSIPGLKETKWIVSGVSILSRNKLSRSVEQAKL